MTSDSEAANLRAMSAALKTATAFAAVICTVGAVYLAAFLTEMSARRTAVAFAAAIFVLGAVYFGRKPLGSPVQVLGFIGTVLLAFIVGWGFWWLVSGPHI